MVTGAAQELYRDNIAVNALSPTGPVRTPLSATVTPELKPEDWEPMETMVEAGIALCTGDPNQLTSRVAYSLPLLVELDRPVYTLDGTRLFEGWQPDRHDRRLDGVGYLTGHSTAHGTIREDQLQLAGTAPIHPVYAPSAQYGPPMARLLTLATAMTASTPAALRRPPPVPSAVPSAVTCVPPRYTSHRIPDHQPTTSGRARPGETGSRPAEDREGGEVRRRGRRASTSLLANSSAVHELRHRCAGRRPRDLAHGPVVPPHQGHVGGSIPFAQQVEQTFVRGRHQGRERGRLHA